MIREAGGDAGREVGRQLAAAQADPSRNVSAHNQDPVLYRFFPPGTARLWPPSNHNSPL